jgi:hypothetical protein
VRIYKTIFCSPHICYMPLPPPPLREIRVHNLFLKNKIPCYKPWYFVICYPIIPSSVDTLCAGRMEYGINTPAQSADLSINAPISLPQVLPLNDDDDDDDDDSVRCVRRHVTCASLWKMCGEQNNTWAT